MPSTATTNITIGTILDLIGPPTVSGPAEEGPAFDAILQHEPPTHAAPLENRKPLQDNSKSVQAAEPESTECSSIGQDAERDQPDQCEQSEEVSKAIADPLPDQDDGPAVNEVVENEEDEIVFEALAGLTMISPTRGVAQPHQQTESPLPAENQDAVESVEPAKKSKTARQLNKEPGAAIKESVPETDTATLAADERETIPQVRSSTYDTDDKANISRGQHVEDPAQSLGIESQSADDKNSAVLTVSDDEPLLQDAGSTAVTASRKPATDQTAQPDSQPLNSGDSAGGQPDIRPQLESNAPPIAAVASVKPSNATPAAAASNASYTAAISSTGATSRGRLPGELWTHRATSPTRQGPIEIDSARLLSRVARAFAAAQERDGEIRLRLSPPELGSLRLEVRVENGALIARLQTETEVARTAIIDNLPVLRERLNEQGVRIERFDVDLMQRQPGGTPDQTGSGQGEAQTPPVRIDQRPRPRSEAPATASSTAATVASSASGLNVII